MDVLPKTTIRKLSSTASLPAELEVTVLTPCIGTQTLTKVGDSYSGTIGDFTVVNLFAITDGGSDSWQLQVVNFDSSPTGCFGFTDYRLDPPDGSPFGNYCLWDGSNKDCSAGQANVT